MTSFLPPLVRTCLGVALVVSVASGQATINHTDEYFLTTGVAFDGFGRAITAGSGRMIIGGNGLGTQGGAVAYRNQAGTWVAHQGLTGSDSVAGDFFGFDAELEGNRLVIGAYQAETPAFNAGAAYVFEYAGDSWTEVQKLTPPVSTVQDNFGASVALAGDLIVVGCRGDDTLGSSAGCAYVFRDVGGTWLLEQQLFASTGDADDQFGWDVKTDGTSIFVSAVSDEGTGGELGAAFSFERIASTWVETQRLTDPAGADGDRFGWTMDFDGNRLFVGAPEAQSGRGRVVVFDGGPGSWVFAESLTPSKAVADDNFGWSVDARGDRFVAGAPGTMGVPSAFRAGAIYGFQHDGTRWVEVQQGLNGEPASGFPPPQMGMSCALLGNSAFGGAPFGHGAGTNGAGSVYRFDLSDIGLDAVPDSVPFEGAFGVLTTGGLADNPMAVFILEISGTPVLLQAYGGTFDAAGRHEAQFMAPASVSGLDIKILAAGYWKPGLVGFSGVVDAAFQ